MNEDEYKKLAFVRQERGGPEGFNLTIPGMAGEPYWLVLANVFRGEDARNRVPPQGAPGYYKVEYVFQRPGARRHAENEVKFAQHLEGDSHWAILQPAFPAPNDAVKIQIHVQHKTERFVFNAMPNIDGFMARIETEPFWAKDRQDAETRSTTIMQGILSHYAAFLDIPLQISLVEVTEISSQNKSVNLLAPFLGAGTSIPLFERYDPEFANFAALYREALSVTSHSYRFLCFYKILEASRKRREKIARKERVKQKVVRENESVPQGQEAQRVWLKDIYATERDWNDLALLQIFPARSHGRKLTAIFDSELRPIRDRIAHGILDSGESFLIDDFAAMRDVITWLPFLRCAVRRTLKNDFPDIFTTGTM